MTQNDLIEVGFIRAAHGLKGHVVVHAYSGEESSLTGYGPLQNKDRNKNFMLTVVNDKGTDFLCRIDGVTERNAAEALRGTKLFVAADKLPPPQEDEFYIRDLIGLAVVDANGTALGTVQNMIAMGAQSAFEIEFIHDGTWPLPKPQIEMLLYTKQNVKQVDVTNKQITVELPYGLLESPPLPSGEGRGEGVEQ